MAASSKKRICDAPGCGVSITESDAYRWGKSKRNKKDPGKNSGRFWLRAHNKGYAVYVCSPQCYRVARADIEQLVPTASNAFDAYAQKWLETKGRYRKTDDLPVSETEYARRTTCVKFWSEHLGSVRMDKADPEVITAALRDLRDRNYAAKTIRKYRDHLKAVFDAASSGTNKLVSRGYVLDLFGQGRGQEGDVPRVFRNQNDDDDHRKFFRPDERAKLAQFDDLTLQAANTKIATLLALNTGMRLGEALALKWVDILDDSKAANIDDPQWVEVRGSINPRREYGPTKSRKERRGKIINSKAMSSALKAHRAIQNITRLQSQAPGWDLGFVCAAEDGLPPKPGTIASTFARRCEWAEITWERPARVIQGKRQWEKKTPKFHFTRSTFITVCIAELKIPQQLVMKWVGHATMSMNDHYFDQTQDDVLLDDETREAMDSLDEAAG